MFVSLWLSNRYILSQHTMGLRNASEFWGNIWSQLTRGFTRLYSGKISKENPGWVYKAALQQVVMWAGNYRGWLTSLHWGWSLLSYDCSHITISPSTGHKSLFSSGFFVHQLLTFSVLLSYLAKEFIGGATTLQTHVPYLFRKWC